MEARDQLPFRPYAPSGALLERTLRRLSLAREDFAITNIGRCRPPQNVLDGAPYEHEAMAQCRPNLLAFLRRFRPRVLLALGGLPLRHLTGLAGDKLSVSMLRGYVLRALPDLAEAAGQPDLVVIPTYHPAFLRRGAIHLTGVLARDIARAVNVAAARDRQYILDLPDLTYWEYAEAAASALYAEKALEAREGLAQWLRRHGLRYNLQPSRRDIDGFCRDVKARSDAWAALSAAERERSYLALSTDVETYESANSLDEDATDGFTDTVMRLSQFSIEPGQGIALQWNQDGIAATRWLLKLPLPKVGHNWELFDRRVLKAVGERDFGDRTYFEPAGPVHDTLFMFHRFQPDLPANLQFAASFAGWRLPWKHLAGSCLPFYGCLDTDATLQVYQTVRRTLESRGMWDDATQPTRRAAGFVAQIEDFRPVLARMEERGFPVDDRRRLELGVEFEAAEREARGELDGKFPDSARKVKPFKTVPVEVRALLEEWNPPMLPTADAVNEKGKPLSKAARGKLEKGARADCYAAVTPELLSRLRSIRFQESPTKDDEGGEEEGERYYYDLRLVSPEGKIAIEDDPEAVQRWCRVYEFSPNSSQQLLAYMEARRHKVPTDRAGKKTTGKKELERLSSKYKDNFYLKVIECREIGKAKGTYVEGYRPHADGRVHTTFTFSTSTDQLASRNPNVTNVSKNARLAKAIRSMYRPADGKLIVEWDFKSYHALTTGFFARSKNYMRLARLDVHSFLGWHLLHLPGADALISLSDGELAEKLKWFKSDPARKHVREKQAKPTCHGVNFGLGYRKLYDMNREHFENEGQAKKTLEMMQRLFPEVFKWQNRIREQAHRQGYLMNPFGSIRWFYEVFVPDGKGGMKPGDQSEEAIAFLPASAAFGNIREAMKELSRRGLDRKWEMVNAVHDSVLFLVEPGKLEEHCTEVYPVLHAPSKVLVDREVAPQGLVVDCECNAGGDWATMEEVKLAVSGKCGSGEGATNAAARGGRGGAAAAAGAAAGAAGAVAAIPSMIPAGTSAVAGPA